MHCVQKITDDTYYVGGSDRRVSLFENVYPIPTGVSYNSYLIADEKTVLLDTVDKKISERFFENISFVLGGRPLDFLIINHMEPDHSAAVGRLLAGHPETKVVGTAKTLALIKQFTGTDVLSRFMTVGDGGTLTTGKHTFRFFTAPMVHWPEVMVTYDESSKTLFSADAFGTFGALSGNICDDNPIYSSSLLPESRRYYTNIVGKYGVQVQALLKKAALLDITRICSLHGPVRQASIGEIVEKYSLWSSYTPESPSVLIAYASIYGNTENSAEIAASCIAGNGIRDISVFDASAVHYSYILSEAFRCSHIIFAATTYNMGLFGSMDTLLRELKAHNLSGRKTAIIENGSWAPAAGKIIKEYLDGMKDMTLLAEPVSVRSSVNDDSLGKIITLAETVAKAVKESTR